METRFPSRLRIFLPFALGYFLSYVYRSINAVIGPVLAKQMDMGPSDLGLLTAAYFITFAAFQLPLGLLLDRFGPRRIEAFLLIAAAAGALVFARAESLLGLVVGRGLIGLGVSACLMAAFKAYVLWFPRGQLPRINGFQMAAGGLGALSATAPVEAALAVTDWRGLFHFLAAATLAVGLLIFLLVPGKKQRVTETGMDGQFKGLGEIVASPVFWRIAPWTTISQATMLAVQGLWAGPWLRDVAGLDRSGVAVILLVTAAAMMTGFILIGILAEHLGRRGIPSQSVAVAGMILFMAAQLPLIAQIPNVVALQWILFGFCGTSGIITYAALSQKFPPHLAGRVNTALNLLVFVAAFSAQWAVGGIISRWPAGLAGGYAPDGYKAAFSILWGMQLLGAAWYAVMGAVQYRSMHRSGKRQ